MTHTRYRIALVGNPNCGKTTIFNALTGRHEHVGNYPGVTVEKRTGAARLDGIELEIVDLPGTYSLTAFSGDEQVTRQFLLEERPDAVINVVDATNLDRNLYLTVQLMELGCPTVVALNMSDLAAAGGVEIDEEKLSGQLGLPVVPTVGNRSEGIGELVKAAIASAGGQTRHSASLRQQTQLPRRVAYGRQIDEMVDHLAELAGDGQGNGRAHWSALKLLENDLTACAQAVPPGQLLAERQTRLLQQAAEYRTQLRQATGESPEIAIAHQRHAFIAQATHQAVRTSPTRRQQLSDRIDRLVTHRLWGLPIFALIMFLVFQMTFWLGNPMVGGLEAGKEQLAEHVRGLWPQANLLQSLICDGIIEGVGAVLVFVPLIFLLFLAISILEGSGYMARAAFLLDRWMHHVGLPGRSFIPMLVGFGCTVPGIMATRTLESRRDRLTTMLVLPLMSCGARLPVYVLILGAFFPPRALPGLGWTGITNQAVLLLVIYGIGIGLAVVAARLLRWLVFRGEVTPFVMELPPYRLPRPREFFVHMWQPTWLYVRKAGTVILAIVIIMWALKSFPALDGPAAEQFQQQRAELTERNLTPDELAKAALELDVREHQAQLEHSAIGRIGKAIAPALRPCGFDWKISTALLGAFAAKEVFVGQLGVIYAVPEHDTGGAESLRRQLAADYTPLQGFCMMLFILIGTPCMATVAVTARESGSWKWAAAQWGGLTILAWLLTAAVYQIGLLAGG